MYSHAFIFYLEEDNGVYIFETNLDDFEANTDKLSVNLEKYVLHPQTKEEFLSIESEVHNKIINFTV